MLDNAIFTTLIINMMIYNLQLHLSRQNAKTGSCFIHEIYCWGIMELV